MLETPEFSRNPFHNFAETIVPKNDRSVNRRRKKKKNGNSSLKDRHERSVCREWLKSYILPGIALVNVTNTSHLHIRKQLSHISVSKCKHSFKRKKLISKYDRLTLKHRPHRMFKDNP